MCLTFDKSASESVKISIFNIWSGGERLFTTMPLNGNSNVLFWHNYAWLISKQVINCIQNWLSSKIKGVQIPAQTHKRREKFGDDQTQITI